MTDQEMAVAALRMLMDHPIKDRYISVDLEFETLYREPEIRVFHYDDNKDITKFERYADRCAEYAGTSVTVHGSFADGFKRLEELIHEQ